VPASHLKILLADGAHHIASRHVARGEFFSGSSQTARIEVITRAPAIVTSPTPGMRRGVGPFTWRKA